MAHHATSLAAYLQGLEDGTLRAQEGRVYEEFVRCGPVAIASVTNSLSTLCPHCGEWIVGGATDDAVAAALSIRHISPRTNTLRGGRNMGGRPQFMIVLYPTQHKRLTRAQKFAHVMTAFAYQSPIERAHATLTADTVQARIDWQTWQKLKRSGKKRTQDDRCPHPDRVCRRVREVFQEAENLLYKLECQFEVSASGSYRSGFTTISVSEVSLLLARMVRARNMRDE